MHLADAFIQSDLPLPYHSVYTFVLSVCVFPVNYSSIFQIKYCTSWIAHLKNTKRFCVYTKLSSEFLLFSVVHMR